MTKLLRIFTVACLSVVFPVAAIAGGEPLLLFAAASTRDAVNDAVEAYRVQNGTDVVVSYGSSGTLARQISAGAPADLYLSANEKWVRWLETRDAQVFQRLTALVGNRLVLIQPKDHTSPLTLGPELAQALGNSRLAIGNTQHVPAGIYAKSALISLGLWDELEPRLAQTKDVRAALALVQRGEAPAGIVYRTDANAAGAIRISQEVPKSTHPPIRYFLASLTASGQKEVQAHKFFDFLTSRRGQSLFEKYGFEPLIIKAGE